MLASANVLRCRPWFVINLQRKLSTEGFMAWGENGQVQRTDTIKHRKIRSQSAFLLNTQSVQYFSTQSFIDLTIRFSVHKENWHYPLHIEQNAVLPHWPIWGTSLERCETSRELGETPLFFWLQLISGFQ